MTSGGAPEEKGSDETVELKGGKGRIVIFPEPAGKVVLEASGKVVLEASGKEGVVPLNPDGGGTPLNGGKGRVGIPACLLAVGL